MEVLILSAQYGFLTPTTPIAHYERRMTPERAQHLHAPALLVLAEYFRSHHPTDIFVNLGRLYRAAITGWDTDLAAGIRVTHARGGLGQRASQMRRWLLEHAGSR